jgi:hypothetical protein
MNESSIVFFLYPGFLPELAAPSCLTEHTYGRVFLCLKALCALFY